jgi:hypothetical protein
MMAPGGVQGVYFGVSLALASVESGAHDQATGIEDDAAYGWVRLVVPRPSAERMIACRIADAGRDAPG